MLDITREVLTFEQQKRGYKVIEADDHLVEVWRFSAKGGRLIGVFTWHGSPEEIRWEADQDRANVGE